MREICLSGSMSGNRKQNRAKPDCDGSRAQPKEATGRLKPLRLFSTLLRGLEMECSHFLLAYPAIASIQLRYITANRRAFMKTLGLLENTPRGRLDLQVETIPPAAETAFAERRPLRLRPKPASKTPRLSAA
jgi:hypothetical protein